MRRNSFAKNNFISIDFTTNISWEVTVAGFCFFIVCVNLEQNRSLRLSLDIFFFSACIFWVLIVLTQVPICGAVSCLNVSNVTLSRLRLRRADGVSSIWGQITGTQLGNISSGCSVFSSLMMIAELRSVLKMSRSIRLFSDIQIKTKYTFWMPPTLHHKILFRNWI